MECSRNWAGSSRSICWLLLCCACCDSRYSINGSLAQRASTAYSIIKGIKKMDRIEFEMNPSYRDFKKAAVKGFLMSNFWRVYFGSIILFLIIIEIFANIYENSRFESIASKLNFTLGIVLIFSLATLMGLVRAAFKSRQATGKMIFFLDEGGYGYKSEYFEVYLKWKYFNVIYELPKYIRMESRIKRKPGVIIFKNLLSEDTVSSIKEILKDVDVPKKRLLPCT